MKRIKFKDLKPGTVLYWRPGINRPISEAKVLSTYTHDNIEYVVLSDVPLEPWFFERLTRCAVYSKKDFNELFDSVEKELKESILNIFAMEESLYEYIKDFEVKYDTPYYTSWEYEAKNERHELLSSVGIHV